LSNGLYKPLALTGCQSSEIRTLHWVDYRDGHLFLRDGKTGPRTVWMSGAARAGLDTLPRTSPWVFPGRKGPERMLAHTWANIRREVNLKDVRLHDIRHSYANVATTSGEDVNSRARTQK
ncbi:MAG: integrase, partial [Rhodobacteraceae bacterium]|nr:integrase [Paracoccaceae bacterium]